MSQLRRAELTSGLPLGTNNRIILGIFLAAVLFTLTDEKAKLSMSAGQNSWYHLRNEAMDTRQFRSMFFLTPAEPTILYSDQIFSFSLRRTMRLSVLIGLARTASTTLFAIWTTIWKGFKDERGQQPMEGRAN